MVKLIEVQAKAREQMIGMEPVANMEEALRRNLDIGVTRGLKLVPTIILSAATTARDTYQRLLALEQGVQQ